MVGMRTERLESFVDWAEQHIKGDEKGEAQVFLDRLFQAFDQQGVKEAGATLEMRVKKSDSKGTAFADLVWKPVVLIEMKRRGEDLSRHYRQAFDYWVRLVPGRPRYTVLCNFDDFWIYDFETQMDTPVDQVTLKELPTRYGPLAFLFPSQDRPTFGNDHEAVTRDAADKLSTCFNKLVRRADVDRQLAQRFILQMLVALFAEDIGLLDKYLVTQLLEDCKSPKDSFDLIGGLFVEMNSPGKTPGGRYKGVDYFNGGLFKEPARLELHADEMAQLVAAAKFDWSKVRPEIFGTLFEHSTDQDERSAYGQHFTHPVDIMKIVGPTIVQPWRELIENADSIKRSLELRKRLTEFIVLDPACGSGNFLYIAYREMKRLESRIFERINELSTRKEEQRLIGFVTANQFYGIDISPLGIELAKVTMMIARKLAIDELKIPERPLPLDNLDGNFAAEDALIKSEPMGLADDRKNWRRPLLNSDGNPVLVNWPKADVIIGNPPFNGAKKLKPDLGPDYVNAIRQAYPEVPGMADYCVFWFRKSHDHLPECTAADPVAGRAGLVGTQNIRNNKSRVGGLDHIAAGGTIVEAVDNQPWSGEANVHVSIANWVKHARPPDRLTQREQAVVRRQLLIPEQPRLWFKVEPEPGKKKIRKTGRGPAAKEYELAFRESESINAALSDGPAVSEAQCLTCNAFPQLCFQGVVPGYDGFAVTDEDFARLAAQSCSCNEVVRPWMIGRDLLTGEGNPSRMILDFANADMQQAQRHAPAFQLLKERVLPAVRESAARASGNMRGARAEHLERWWQFWNVRSEMREALHRLNRYIACSRVTKRPIFAFVSVDILPDGALQVWALEDDYSFGVIQSAAHWQWFYANCSKLKSDFRYTRRSVWDTFPWPQSPSAEAVEAVAAAAVHIRGVRQSALKNSSEGLRGLYRLLELPGQHPLKVAHQQLDRAVVSAYGFNPRRSILEQLLELNNIVVTREQNGVPATGPGVPNNYADESKLVTDDCVSRSFPLSGFSTNTKQ